MGTDHFGDDFKRDAVAQIIERAILLRRFRSGSGSKPQGGTSIHSHEKRGTGIINDELAIGRFVWSRLRSPSTPRPAKASHVSAATASSSKAPASNFWIRMRIRLRDRSRHRARLWSVSPAR